MQTYPRSVTKETAPGVTQEFAEEFRYAYTEEQFAAALAVTGYQIEADKAREFVDALLAYMGLAVIHHSGTGGWVDPDHERAAHHSFFIGQKVRFTDEYFDARENFYQPIGSSPRPLPRRGRVYTIDHYPSPLHDVSIVELDGTGVAWSESHLEAVE